MSPGDLPILPSVPLSPLPNQVWTADIYLAVVGLRGEWGGGLFQAQQRLALGQRLAGLRDQSSREGNQGNWRCRCTFGRPLWLVAGLVREILTLAGETAIVAGEICELSEFSLTNVAVLYTATAAARRGLTATTSSSRCDGVNTPRA